MNKPTWTDEQFIKFFSDSTSIADLAQKLGLSRTNSAIERKIQEYQLDTSVFLFNKLKIASGNPSFKYTPTDIKSFCERFYCFSDVLREMGMLTNDWSVNSCTIERLQRYVASCQIDISHFKTHKRSIRNNARNAVVRAKLIKDRGNLCECCGLSWWNNQPISIQMHHLDGNRKNNENSNLQLLCPNCHTLTPNYGSKNKVKPRTR